MKKICIVSTMLLLGISVSVLQAQIPISKLHGTDAEYRSGIHSGNQFRISFFNDGTYGAQQGNNDAIRGEWPINSGHIYLDDGNIFVGSEVTDNTGQLVHIISENKSYNLGGSMGDKSNGTTGDWWTFLPLPGFAKGPVTVNNKIAMTKGSTEWIPDPNHPEIGTWPVYWPDKLDDPNDPGWRNDKVDKDPLKAAWNGYFGKNVFNADEESYFVADDYNNREFKFYPDSADTNRRGLGLRLYVRGFQWSKGAVEDGIFCLYDIENIGTHQHDKMVFGYKIGNNMGETIQTPGGAESNDDNANYSRDEDLAYMYDTQPGASTWGPDPVGYMGGAFLESPGNSFDGIDNDNDGQNGPGINVATGMFDRGTLGVNDQIVLIDYKTFQRKLTTLHDTLLALGRTDADSLEVGFAGRTIFIKAQKNLLEIGDNLIDDNLNGLIDENRGLQDQDNVFQYLYISSGGTGYKCINYFNTDSTTNGMTNLMLDEARNDGVDNDGDWNPGTDDVGVDGLGINDRNYPGPDFGEADGIPTAGEPHFDKTDIDESDMIGLTSFQLYQWQNAPQQSDDGLVWGYLTPGNFTFSLANQNIELFYGSGYFPLVPGQTERFSIGIICGEDYNTLLRNKGFFATAYNQNYNFSKAPLIPTVKAIAGDNKVTLLWDNLAESSDDPISGFDFEGYKIYRSTDPGFNDCKPITDAYGSVIFREPIAQFDSVNAYSGLAPIPTQGAHFNLGRNTGIRHYWVDTTAKNGYTYYYAVTSYDHGDPNKSIDPSECSKYIAVSLSGTIEKGTNVVIVRPEAPSAGYMKPDFKDAKIIRGANNTASGTVDYNIVDPTLVKDNHQYQITFQDTTTGAGANRTKSTTGFTLVDISSQDTLFANSPLLTSSDEAQELVNKTGFKLSFIGNPSSLQVDTNTSIWNRSEIPNCTMQMYSATNLLTDFMISDFKIVIGQVGKTTSKYFRSGTTAIPAVPVNFNIVDTRTGNEVDFAFRERDTLYGDSSSGSKKGVLSFGRTGTASLDEIIFLAKADSPWVASWWVRFNIGATTDSIAKLRQLVQGDSITLYLNKPFLSHDTLWFTTRASAVDQQLAKVDMDKIRVVPNPYIVTNSWEPKNPYVAEQRDRQLHFTHLPQQCTIKIYNVRGQLVNTLEHNSTLGDGTYIWNMLSRDNLEISYGIYIYHVKAEGVGEKIGKFVVIK